MGIFGTEFLYFCFRFWYVNFLIKSCSKMALGLTQSSLKERSNWLTATMAAAAFATVPSYPISGQLGTAHMMTYNLMRKWNLLVLNFPTGQSDMLVVLCSNGCILFLAWWLRPHEIGGLSQVTPQSAFFALNIAISGQLGTAHIYI